jgi:hypothetical protein
MHGPINVKSPDNISEWQMGFNSAFKGLNFRFLYSLTLFLPWFFRLSSILLGSPVIKGKVAILSIEYFLGISGNGPTFYKILDAIMFFRGSVRMNYSSQRNK